LGTDWTPTSPQPMMELLPMIEGHPSWTLSFG